MQEDMKADRTFFQACKNILDETGCVPDKDNKDAIHSMSETLTCLLDAEVEADKECKLLDTINAVTFKVLLFHYKVLMILTFILKKLLYPKSNLRLAISITVTVSLTTSMAMTVGLLSDSCR